MSKQQKFDTKKHLENHQIHIREGCDSRLVTAIQQFREAILANTKPSARLTSKQVSILAARHCASIFVQIIADLTNFKVVNMRAVCDGLNLCKSDQSLGISQSWSLSYMIELSNGFKLELSTADGTDFNIGKPKSLEHLDWQALMRAPEADLILSKLLGALKAIRFLRNEIPTYPDSIAPLVDAIRNVAFFVRSWPDTKLVATNSGAPDLKGIKRRMRTAESSDSHSQAFCELCWRLTEYAASQERIPDCSPKPDSKTFCKEHNQASSLYEADRPNRHKFNRYIEAIYLKLKIHRTYCVPGRNSLFSSSEDDAVWNKGVDLLLSDALKKVAPAFNLLQVRVRYLAYEMNRRNGSHIEDVILITDLQRQSGKAMTHSQVADRINDLASNRVKPMTAKTVGDRLKKLSGSIEEINPSFEKAALTRGLSEEANKLRWSPKGIGDKLDKIGKDYLVKLIGSTFYAAALQRVAG